MKSTDDDMIRTLEGLSGVTHKSFIDQKTVTRDNERLFFANEGKTGYTMTTKEIPVISKNDMLFISDAPGCSMVFRAGNSPIWNKGHMSLPMSWKLIKDNPVRVPGKTFNLQTVPSTSTVLDFDVENNQPDFMKLLDEELDLARSIGHVKQVYMEKTGLSEVDIERLDKDVYSQDIMRMLSQQAYDRKQDEAMAEEAGYGEDDMYSEDDMYGSDEGYMSNEELAEDLQSRMADKVEMERKCFAKGTLSKEQVIHADGSLKAIITQAYADNLQYFEKDRLHFRVKNKSLWSYDERVEYVHYNMQFYEDLKKEAAESKGAKVYDGTTGKKIKISKVSKMEERFAGYEVQPAFFEYLASIDNWEELARGYFSDQVAREVQISESV